MAARYIADHAVVAAHIRSGGGVSGVKDAVRNALHTPDVRHAWAAVYTELILDTGYDFAQAQLGQLEDAWDGDWADVPDGDIRSELAKYAAGYTQQRVPDMLDATSDLINRRLAMQIMAGMAVSQILDELNGVYGTLQTDGAQALAEFETVSAGNFGMELGATLAPIEVEKTWAAVIDDKTRPWHADADGQTVPRDQPFQVGDEQMMYPTDTSLGASGKNIYNCRCVSGYTPAGALSETTETETAFADLLIEMKEWDESAHPRDDHGRFGSGDGGAAATATDNSRVKAILDEMGTHTRDGVVYSKGHIYTSAAFRAMMKATGQDPQAFMDAMDKWSFGDSNAIVKAQLAGEPAELVDAANTIESGLAAMPKYDGTLYSFMEPDHSWFSDQQEGDTFNSTALVATTSNAESGYGDSNRDALVISGNTTGVSIAGVSQFPSEGEVLVPSGASYRVTKVVNRGDLPEGDPLRANAYSQKPGKVVYVQQVPATKRMLTYGPDSGNLNLDTILREMKEWDEDAHPRGPDGRFGEGEGGGGDVDERQTGSGRGGSSWVNAPNRTGARANLAEQFPNVGFFDLKSMDTGTVNSLGRALSAVRERYGFEPNAITIDNSHRWIPESDVNVQACVAIRGFENEDIQLSPVWYKSGGYTRLNQQTAKDEKMGWGPNKSDDPSSIIIHEMGHVAYNHMNNVYESLDSRGRDEANRAWADAMRKWSNTYDPASHGASVSQYAKASPAELWAECFSWLHSDHEGALYNPACEDMDKLLKSYQEWESNR